MSYAIATFIVIILDQLLKFWVTRNIGLNETMNLIPGVIHLTDVHNTGAAFGIFADARWLLIIVTMIFVIGIIILLSRDIIHGDLGRWSALLIMAGALSNGLDRALYGYVVDMFEVEFIRFAVFNIADIFITVFGILFCIYVIQYKPEEGEMEWSIFGNKKEERRKTPKTVNIENLFNEEEDSDTFLDDTVLDEETDEETVEQRPNKRQRKEKPATVNIPKRGVHKTIKEEFAPENPDDPFAEWETSAEVEENAEKTEDEPEKTEVANEDDSLNLSFSGFESPEYSLEDILSEFNNSEG